MDVIKLIVLPKKKLFEIDLGELNNLEDFQNRVNEITKNNEDLIFFSNGKQCSFDEITDISKNENNNLFAISKSVTPLKRKFVDNELNDILNTGLHCKKLRNEMDSSSQVFKVPTINDVKSVIDNNIESNPSNIEQIVAQPQVQFLMQNNFVAPSLLAASSNFQINPSKVRAFTDKSQINWVQKEFNQSPGDLSSLFNDYADQKNQINNHTRVKKVTDLYNKMSESSLEQDNFKDFSSFIKGQYATEMMDLLSENNNYSESVLKLCPYGPNLLKDELKDIQDMYPKISTLYKDALTQSGNNDIMKYLKENPIQVDKKTAERLMRASSTLTIPDIKSDDETKECSENVSNLIMKTLDYLVKKQDSENVAVENKEMKYSKQIKQLKEMGFLENDGHVSDEIYDVLESEMGSLERCVMKLIQ